MKKLLLILSLFILFTTNSRASHLIGGEIGWNCLPNGQFEFFMNVYRDCTGVGWQFKDETIDITANILPKDSNGVFFNSILMKPDSVKWSTGRFGDASPKCTKEYGNEYSCDNADRGSTQQFFYKSDPITLEGVPPKKGWRFYWEAVCCRSNQIENLGTRQGNMLLRAFMLPSKDKRNTSKCFDSSPRFTENPHVIFCRGEELTYSFNALDTDFDSLKYSWNFPINSPISNPLYVPFSSGYSYDNPTPNTGFDNRNRASKLDTNSGIVKMAVYNGIGNKKYSTVVQVQSFRDGVRISSVYREMPISINSCPLLPNGDTNKSPKTVYANDTTLNYSLKVYAGQEIRLPINVIDGNYWDTLNNQQQIISMIPDGLMFSKDRKSPSLKKEVFGRGDTLEISPFAYLQNLSPFYDTLANPPLNLIQDTGNINTEFVWQTNCSHLQKNALDSGRQKRSYHFIFKIYDDHCPIPGINFSVLDIELKDHVKLTEPVMKGASISLNGEISYQWIPPLDSTFAFNHYNVESSSTDDMNLPVNWSFLDTNLKTFQQEHLDTNYAIFNYINSNPVNGFDILNKVPNKDWYIRMTSFSGCSDSSRSLASEPVRIVELEASVSINPNDSSIKAVILDWNAPKSDTANSYQYFQYESKTRYYIWQNDSVSLSGLKDISNWYIIDSTLETEKLISPNFCNRIAAFRIEARDTVITWQQGNVPDTNSSNIDTLFFSTFSTIDTVLLEYEKPLVNRVGLDILNTPNIATNYQWVNCSADSIITNANQQTIVLTDTGSYSVIVENGICKDTSSCFTVDINLNKSIEYFGSDTLKSLDSLANYQWFNCGLDSIIIGATNQKFAPMDSGYYAVIVSGLGFTDTSACIPFFPVGLPEIIFQDQVSFYPNPTSGLVQINLEESTKEVTIQVLNIQGQLMKEERFNDQSFLLELPTAAGIYFIQLTNEKGERANLKVVKQ